LSQFLLLCGDIKASIAGKKGEALFMLHTSLSGLSSRLAHLGHSEKDGEQRDRVQRKATKNEQRSRKSSWLG